MGERRASPTHHLPSGALALRTHGKLCAVLAAKARAAGAKTILISGAVAGDLGEVDDLFDAVFAAVQDVGSLEDALESGRKNLAITARSVGRVLAMQFTA